MPRRRKPPGYERWTWAEINAGRKFSKTERRWRRYAQSMNWDQRPDGTYKAPPQAIPFLVIIAGLMIAIGVLAPNGTAKASPDVQGLVALLSLLLIPAFILLTIFGRDDPYAGNSATLASMGHGKSRPQSSPTEPFFGPMIAKGLRQTLGLLDRGFDLLVFVVSFQWVSRLPDWAQPIAWGVAISLPAAIATSLMLGGHPETAWPLMAVALALSIGAAIDIVRTRHRWREQAAKDEVARQEEAAIERRRRFRGLIVRLLRRYSADQFRFGDWVVRCGMARDEADTVAEEIYRLIADKVFADGILTPSERDKLDNLGRALEISPDRADQIESKSKAARYRMAESEAWADGILTEDESQYLQSLRHSLGLR